MDPRFKGLVGGGQFDLDVLPSWQERKKKKKQWKPRQSTYTVTLWCLAAKNRGAHYAGGHVLNRRQRPPTPALKLCLLLAVGLFDALSNATEVVPPEFSSADIVIKDIFSYIFSKILFIT